MPCDLSQVNEKYSELVKRAKVADRVAINRIFPDIGKQKDRLAFS